MLEVVYIAFRGSDLTKTLDRLRGAGLHPVLLDDPDPDFALVHAAARSIRIRVAVPKVEIPAAVELLRAAGREPESTRKLARRFELGALRFAIFVAILVGLAALGHGVEPDFPWHYAAFGIGAAWALWLLIRANFHPKD